MIRRPPRSTRVRSSAASDVYKRQQDPPTLLLFTTLSSISHSRRPKSLRPADRILIRPIWGFWGGSRKPRWESCRRPPGVVPAPFGLSWRRLRVLFTPGRGLRATAHCEPRRTADLVTVPLLLLRVRLPQTESREAAGIEGWSTKKRLWRGGTLSKASSPIHTGWGILCPSKTEAIWESRSVPRGCR